MDFSSHIQTIVGLLAFLLLLYGVLKISSKTKKGNWKQTGIPEASGALPFIGHLYLLGGRDPIAKTLGAMADKHGPFFAVRLGHQRLLVVSGWEMAKECLSTHDKVLATRPNIAAGKYLGYNNAILALAPYGEYWRDIRKMAALELLSNQRLEMLKPVRVSEVDSLIKDLHSLSTKNADGVAAVTISKLFEKMTFNVNFRMIAGKRFSTSTYGARNSEASRFQRAIKEALFLSGVFVLSDAIPSLEWLDYQGYVSSMKRTYKEIDEVLTIWLDEHLQKKANGESNSESDFMDVMISNLAEDALMSGHARDTVIKANAFILILTGAGSAAVTLTWVVSLLLNNPSILKAVQEELDLQIGKDKWVQESDISNLKYLQAIVKETLRLYPPGPLTGLREAMEDCNINGFYVPKGTRLIVNIWKLQRDPRVWSNPNEFQPERFMKTHANLDFRGQNFEYIPFSSGRRSCPGITFGMQMVHFTLARLLQGFDLNSVAGMPVTMREGLGIALPKADPLEVVLTPRLPMELYQCL